MRWSSSSSPSSPSSRKGSALKVQGGAVDEGGLLRPAFNREHPRTHHDVAPSHESYDDDALPDEAYDNGDDDVTNITIVETPLSHF